MRRGFRKERKISKSRRVINLAIIGILLVGAIGGIVLYRGAIMAKFTKLFAAVEENPIPEWTLERSPLQVEVQADGEITGLESIPLPTPTIRQGSLKVAWLIPEGTMVSPGVTVIKYDNTDALLSMESQQNVLKQSELTSAVQTGTQQLSERTMAIDITVAQMDYEYSMQVMPTDPTIFSQWDIIQAGLNAQFAKAKLDNLGAKAKVQKRINRSQTQQLTIRINQAQTQIDIVQQALDAMELKSPVSGLLIYRRNRQVEPKVGDNCQAGQVIVEVVNLDALQARIYVSEKEAGNLEKGKPVIIQLDALPDKLFHGEVRAMSPVAASIARNSPLKYFTCDVTIRDAGPYLRYIRPGMTLHARVVLEKYDSCFMVPASAVDFRDEGTFVYIKKGNDFEKRAVQIGMGKHGQATILSGVNEKEIVALRNPFETKALKLPDFGKATTADQQRRGGPGMQQMQQMQQGGSGGFGGGGGGGGGRGR
jgi:HlyD family secretion protein